MAVMEDITARKQVQEALRESEAKFRASFDQAPIGAAIVSLDYRFQRVNDELCRLTGYSAAELASRTFLDITHPEDMAESEKQGERLGREEIESYQMEKRYIRQDGETVWVRLSVRLVKDAQGAPRYFLSMMEDITERRRAEAALKESANQYRLLVKQIPAVVFKGYQDWSVDFFDRKIEKLTGYLKEEFDSRQLKWCDLVHPEDLDMFRGVFKQALKTDKSYVREYRIRKKDGEIVWIQARGQIFCDAPVRLIMSAGYSLTSRRKAAEEVLKELKTNPALVNQIPAIVFKGFRAGGFTKFEELTGYNKEASFGPKQMVDSQKIIRPRVFIEALKTESGNTVSGERWKDSLSGRQIFCDAEDC